MTQDSFLIVIRFKNKRNSLHVNQLAGGLSGTAKNISLRDTRIAPYLRDCAIFNLRRRFAPQAVAHSCARIAKVESRTRLYHPA